MNSLIKQSTSLLAPQLDYILIDGSGSMQEKWWDTLAGLDAFMKVLQAQNISSHGIVHVFDNTEIHLIARDSEISSWPTFIDEPFGAHWGGTPLYDAINLMVRRMATLDPERASIVIITDGDENASTHTTVHEARALLDWCRAKGWQVTFLGADFNNSRQSRALGATDSNSIGVRKMKLLEAGKVLGEKRARHAISGTDISFTSEEKENFGGYLTGPSNG